MAKQEKIGKGMSGLWVLAFGAMAFMCHARMEDQQKIEQVESYLLTGPLGDVAKMELSNGDLAAAGKAYKFGSERDSIRVEGGGENVRVLKFNSDPTKPALEVEMDRPRYLRDARARHGYNEPGPSREADLVPSYGPHGERLIGGVPLDSDLPTERTHRLDSPTRNHPADKKGIHFRRGS